ncbi:fructosamine kinase family protein [Kocuria palustris]|uniref:fructosamine kinase family protein n=1 Tax=Kocuria palustris TaxID=71999 RepID=UPI0011A115E6|nr:fructosamine kinase family protein [Kocuria palustris]
MTREHRHPEQHIHRKSSDGSSPGVFALEAAGLLWLDEGPVRCAGVHDVGADFLELTRVDTARPAPEAAREFGRALARTHDLGADGFGAAPPVPAASSGWTRPAPSDGWRSGWFGPLEQPLEVTLEPTESWGAFYGGQRVRPMLEMLRDRGVAAAELEAVQGAVEALEAGQFDDGDSPARIHGDLWAGNLLWSSEGAVLIDPAAHGDHREQDLAFLSVFGAPHLEEIIAGYEEAHPLRDGWRERTGLHQLFVLIAHAVLFDPPRGGTYLGAADRAARSALELL